MSNEKIAILKHDLSEPEKGLFAVKLAKGAPECALSVTQDAGQWVVILNGKPVAPASRHWENAFGKFALGFLFGRQIEFNEYTRILNDRMKDAFEGRSIYHPVDFNKLQTAF